MGHRRSAKPCNTSRSGTEAGVSQKLDSEDIVYAQLRQDSIPSNTDESADEPYLNFKALKDITLTSESPREGWSCAEMCYADVSSGLCQSAAQSKASHATLYHLPWDSKVGDEETYEPVGSFCPKEDDTIEYFNSKSLAAQSQSLANKNVESETYEFIERSPDDADTFNKTAPHKQPRPRPRSHLHLCRSSSSGSGMYDNFNSSDGHYLNEFSFDTYEPIKNEDSPVTPQRRKGICQLETPFLESHDRRSVGRRHSIQTEYECRDMLVSTLQNQPLNDSNDKGETEVHQNINFKTSKPLKKSSSAYLLGLSRPDEIYEGIEWNPPKQKSATLPHSTSTALQRQRAHGKTVSQARVGKSTGLGDLQRASTISGFGRSLNDVYYAEVTLSSAMQYPDSETSQYIDIIANYEDIKAAKAARGSFSGPSMEKEPQDVLPMRRIKSEMGRSAALTPGGLSNYLPRCMMALT